MDNQGQNDGVAGILQRNLATELRTPLLEVLLESTRQQNSQLQVVARHALELYDGFLLSQELDLWQVSLGPCSLLAETEDVLHHMDDLAKLYSVQLQLSAVRLRTPAALNRRIYQTATKVMLYAIITSLQNQPSAQINLCINSRGGPNLTVTSSDMTLLQEDIQAVATQAGRQRPAPMTSGVVSGLVVADRLLRGMGTGVEAAKAQGESGFRARFAQSLQLSLIGEST